MLRGNDHHHFMDKYIKIILFMRKYDAHSPVDNISPSLHLNCKKYKVLKIKYKTYCWLSFTK